MRWQPAAKGLAVSGEGTFDSPSQSVLQADPRLKGTLTRFDERAALFPKQMERY